MSIRLLSKSSAGQRWHRTQIRRPARLPQAIKIVYDSKNRISEIYAPSEQGTAVPTISYEYDDFDNLTKVHKLTTKTASDPNAR